MSNPEPPPPLFDLPEPDSASTPRRPDAVGGWISLWVILALLVGGQLYGYFSRNEKETPPYLQIAQGYRSAILIKESQKRMPASLRKFFGDPNIAGDETDLENFVAQVVGERKSDPNAARLYVSMRYEMGKKILPEDLEFIRKQKDGRQQAFAEIYAADKLSQERAAELAKTVGVGAFTFRMAQVHAYEKAGDTKARTRLFADSEIAMLSLGLFLAMSAFGVGCLALLIYFVLRLNGRSKPRGHPAGKLDRWQANTFAGRAALILFVWIALGIGTGFLASYGLREEVAGLLGDVLVLGFIVLLFTSGSTSDGPTMRLFGFDRSRFWKDIVWGIGAAFANIPLLLCVATIGNLFLSGLPSPEHPLTTQLTVDQDLVTVLLLGSLAAILAPLFEETVFRGLMVPAMARLFNGPVAGVVVSSLVFAAIHPTGIPAWPALAMTGAMAAMICYQRGSLVSSFAFHATHNFGLLVLMLLIY